MFNIMKHFKIDRRGQELLVREQIKFLKKHGRRISEAQLIREAIKKCYERN